MSSVDVSLYDDEPKWRIHRPVLLIALCYSLVVIVCIILLTITLVRIDANVSALSAKVDALFDRHIDRNQTMSALEQHRDFFDSQNSTVLSKT